MILHIICYYTISYHIISYHIISYHIIHTYASTDMNMDIHDWRTYDSRSRFLLRSKAGLSSHLRGKALQLCRTRGKAAATTSTAYCIVVAD